MSSSPTGGLSIGVLGAGLRSRRWSATDIVEESLREIRRTQPTFSAFVETENGDAVGVARDLDREMRAGRDRGPLHGIPFAAKDVFAVAGRRMRAGSAAYDELATADATAIAALRAAGAVLIGRTRLHELAFGPTGINGFDGGARNPRDEKRIPGGSSSGSAAAVAAGICPGALGSDTGGSCRVPAACCDIVGFKPTYGLVPTEGVLPLSQTLDHVGLLTNSASDAWTLTATMAGHLAEPLRERLPQSVGVLSGREETTDTVVADAFDRVLRKLAQVGTRIVKLELASIEHVAAIAGRIMFHEAYGVHKTRLSANPERFGPDVRARLEEGASISTDAYADALRERDNLRRRSNNFFLDVEVLVSPTLPIVPPTLEEVADPRIRGMLPRNTRLYNMLGLPTISIPIPGCPLPVGLQVAGALGADRQVLGMAAALESLIRQ